MALACLGLKNERKGSSSLYVWFSFEQKGKTVNARLQCLKGALLYTNGDKSIELYLNIRVNINIIRIIRHNLKTLQIRTIEGSLVTFLFLQPKSINFLMQKRRLVKVARQGLFMFCFEKRKLRRIKFEIYSCFLQRKKFKEIEIGLLQKSKDKDKKTRYLLKNEGI
jgi:hypothetical protein